MILSCSHPEICEALEKLGLIASHFGILCTFAAEMEARKTYTWNHFPNFGNVFVAFVVCLSIFLPRSYQSYFAESFEEQWAADNFLISQDIDKTYSSDEILSANSRFPLQSHHRHEPIVLESQDTDERSNGNPPKNCKSSLLAGKGFCQFSESEHSKLRIKLLIENLSNRNLPSIILLNHAWKGFLA